MTDRSVVAAEAWTALSTVRDPELDEPITDLGFVADVQLGTAGEIAVQLRLPTYFCAPNFAWLMVADARDALTAVPGAGTVRVELVDHFAADEINAGVAAGSGFSPTFARHADAEQDSDLNELRITFERKAHQAAEERLAGALRVAGVQPAELPDMRLEEAARLAPEAAAAVVRRRRPLGLDATASATAFCTPEGLPVSAESFPRWLLQARSVRVSIDGNGMLCRGLLATRYGEDATEPAASRVG